MVSRDLTEARISKFPKCDFCPKNAAYDGKTKAGPWASMCEDHWHEHGNGKLGLGLGQKLVLKENERYKR